MELKLEERTTILDGIVQYEPINVSLLDKCINSTLIKENYHDDHFYSTEKVQLEKYRDLVHHDLAKVLYKRKEGMPYGRVNPSKSLGLHSLNRKTRHTLTNGTMIDIDIVNPS